MKNITFIFALLTMFFAMGATSQMGALRPSSVVVTNEDDAAGIAFSQSATNALWAATLALGDENLAAATNYAGEAAYAAKTGAVQEATAGIDGSIGAATNALWGSTVGLAERVFDEATNNTAEAVMSATNSILVGAYEHADAAAEAAKNEAVRQATNAVESAEERGRLALKASTNALWTAVRSSTNDLWAATVNAIGAETARAIAGENAAKTGAVAQAGAQADAKVRAATNALWSATKEETRGLASVAYVDAKTRVAESGHPEAIYDGTNIITAARGYLQVRADDWYIDGSAWSLPGLLTFVKTSETGWEYHDELAGDFSLQYGDTPTRWRLYEPNNGTPFIGMTAADHEMPETNATARALWWRVVEGGEGTDGLLQDTTNRVGTLALEGGGGGLDTNAVREISGGVATNVVRGMAGEFGKVQSVNGQTGAVVLAAHDLGAVMAVWDADSEYYCPTNRFLWRSNPGEDEGVMEITPWGITIGHEADNMPYSRLFDNGIEYSNAEGGGGLLMFPSWSYYDYFASQSWTSNAVKNILSSEGAVKTNEHGKLAAPFIVSGNDEEKGIIKVVDGDGNNSVEIKSGFRGIEGAEIKMKGISNGMSPNIVMTDGNYGPVAEITIGDMRVRSAISSVSNAVSAWEAYWSGDKVRLSVTNYYGNTSGDSPRLRIEESQTNAQGVATNWVQVWDENTKYTNFTAGITAQVDGISNAVMTAAWRQTNLQLANKAPRAWQTVSSAGGYAPADTVWMTAPKTVFAGGTEWAHVAVGEGTIAVLTDKGAGVYTSGEEGVFRFTDESGENYFGFDVRASYTLGCRTDGITVGEGNLVTLTYNLVAADNPQVLHCTNLTANTWSQLGDGEISWEQNPPEGTKICYINTGGAPQGFYKAQIQYAGGSKFVTNMQADLAGGIAATNEALNVVQSIYPVITSTGIVWRVKQ